MQTFGIASADPPKRLDPKTAEANLRRAKETVEKVDGGLRAVSAALWTSSVLKGNPDLRISGGKTKGLVERLKRFRLSGQKDELERIGKAVAAMPVGRVIDAIDPKLQVSVDLLVRSPREANDRFRAYLKAIQTNIGYIEARREQLADAAKVCKATGTFFAALAAKLEKPAGVWRPLAECYLELDGLSNVYNSLAGDAANKAREIGMAIEVEKKRHATLKTTIKTVFGFNS